jgi:N-acetylmuramoyl-L-alanine amidase
MKIAMSSGHGKYIRGASGSPVPPQLDEVDQARRVVDRTAQILNSMGVHCVTFHDNTSHDQSTNLETITNWHNAQSRDYDVSVHFNAYDGSAHGVEVLYVTQETLAGKVSSAIAAAGSFTNRGAKYRGDLYVLNNTDEPCILLEVCFCDHTGDSNNYNAKFEKICEAIAESISGKQAGTQPPVEQPPVEPPVEETAEARVDIVGTTAGSVAVYVNGTRVNRAPAKCRNVVRLNIRMSGDVVVCLNGEEFHNKPETPPERGGVKPNHKDIEATVFGGEADQENSAYKPYDLLNDTDLYLSLPYSFDPNLFPDNPPMVRVFCGEKSAVAAVRDKGPWTTDDERYVMGSKRPIAEHCYETQQPLPSGPNQGQIPKNKAGIDLSPALAAKIGVSGKGIVSWRFEDEAVA